MWYQALASVSALRTFRDPPAQWRSFSRRDAIPAWGRLYNRLHPGVDIYSVHFVKKMPWCQYFNGHGSRTDCQLPDGSEVSLAVMLPDSLGGSVKYIKGFAFEIRTSFPQDLAAPKQAYVRNMQVVVSHEQRDYREPLISHAELVGEEGFTFVPDFSSVKPPRHGVSMWHHVLGVHSDRIPSILGVASGDAPRSYLPPRVEYVGFARDLEQAFNLLACSLRAPDGTGWVSFDHLVRSELTSAAWETLVIHTERLAGSWQGERAEGWRRLLECGPTFLFNVLRLSTGPDGHFMSVLSSQRVAFGIQGLFGTGKTYCASAALILLTRMLGLKALFVAEPNLPLQEFSRNVQSLLADAPEEVLCQFPRLLGRDHDDVAYETRSQFRRDNEPCCVAITLGSLLHEIGRRGPLASFLQAIHLMFVDESQQAGQAAYVAVHGAVHCTALTVHIGDDRQTRGASGNDPRASHRTSWCWRRHKSLANVHRKRSLPP